MNLASGTAIKQFRTPFGQNYRTVYYYCVNIWNDSCMCNKSDIYERTCQCNYPEFLLCHQYVTQTQIPTLLFIYLEVWEDHLQRSEMCVSTQHQVDYFFEGCTNAQCRLLHRNAQGTTFLRLNAPVHMNQNCRIRYFIVILMDYFLCFVYVCWQHCLGILSPSYDMSITCMQYEGVCYFSSHMPRMACFHVFCTTAVCNKATHQMDSTMKLSIVLLQHQLQPDRVHSVLYV